MNHLGKIALSSIAFASLSSVAAAQAFSFTSADGSSNYLYNSSTAASFSSMYLMQDGTGSGTSTVLGTLSVSINISGTGLLLSNNLSVRFTNLAHTWVGDTAAYLTASDGRNVILWDRPGRTSGTSFGSSFNFDPNRSYSIAASGATSWTTTSTTGATLNQVSLNSGVYAPLLNTSTGSSLSTLSNVTTLSGLNGVALDGTWTLTIIDGASGDVGALRNFSIAGDAVPEPASMTALALGAAAMLRRRKKSK